MVRLFGCFVCKSLNSEKDVFVHVNTNSLIYRLEHETSDLRRRRTSKELREFTGFRLERLSSEHNEDEEDSSSMGSRTEREDSVTYIHTCIPSAVVMSTTSRWKRSKEEKVPRISVLNGYSKISYRRQGFEHVTRPGNVGRASYIDTKYGRDNLISLPYSSVSSSSLT